MSTPETATEKPSNGDVEIINEPSSKTSSRKRRTGTLEFSFEQFQLISALTVAGGYASVEDFCERASAQEAERQFAENAKRRGNRP